MARLTWDAVRGPDFSGVTDSYRNMSTMLGNAVQSGLGMIDTVRDTNSAAADRAIMARLAGVTDPSQFNAASIIGADARNASAGTLQAVGNRPGTLLDWATSRNSLEQSQYGFGRTKEANEILDNPANRSAIEQARTIATAGDLAGAQRMLSGLGLRTDQFASVFGDLEQSATSSLNREATQQRLDQNDYAQGRTERTDSISDQTEAARAFLAKNAADPAHAEQLLWQQGYKPEVINRLLGSAIGGAGAGGGAALPSSGAAWAQSVGLLSSESGGNYAASNNAVGSGGKAGHFGALQFGHDRLSDAKRAGVIPSDMTAEQFRTSGKDVQDKVADWHFADIDKQATNAGLDKYFGQTIGGVAINRDSIRGMAHLGGMGGVRRFIESGGALNPADANGTRLSDYGQRFGAPAAQMQQVLAQGAAAVTDANVQADIQRAGGMANSGSLNQRLATMEGNDVDMTTLTRSLTDEGGPLAGYSQGEVAQEIRAIAAQGKISNAQAAEILKENVVPRNVALRALSTVVPFAKLAENTFDRDMNLETARQYKAGGLGTIDQNNRRVVAGQQIGQVQQQLQALDQQIAAATQRYQITQSPEILQRVQQLRAERAMLAPLVEGLMDNQQNDPNLTTRDFAAELKRRNDLVRRGVTEGVARAFPADVPRAFQGDRNMR